MEYRTLDTIREQLAAIGPVWVYLAAYRITLGQLHLLLTDQHFKKKADLFMGNCFFICGPTTGGPWQLEITELEEDGQKIIKIVTTDETFVVKGLRAQLSLPEPEDFFGVHPENRP